MKLIAKKRNALPKSSFGLPGSRKYSKPLRLLNIEELLTYPFPERESIPMPGDASAAATVRAKAHRKLAD